jgi:hypothetical protein
MRRPTAGFRGAARGMVVTDAWASLPDSHGPPPQDFAERLRARDEPVRWSDESGSRPGERRVSERR